MGIYDLNGMENAQSWFLRSGGIMDEIAELTVPKKRLSKGQQAIGLAWETYCAGAEHYDRVMQESEMSPGQWWKNFRPADRSLAKADEAEAYEGYTLFESNNDNILTQANQYQSELDIIRSTSKEDHRHIESVKNALVMRSDIAQEMAALFGGESLAEGAVAIRKVTSSPEISDPEPAKSIQPEKILSAPITEEPAVDVAVVETPELELENSLTIQIGAFVHDPDFSEVASKSSIFKLGTNGNLTKYAIGNYESEAEALHALEQVRQWAPDAFLTKYHSVTPPLPTPSTPPVEVGVDVDVDEIKTKKVVKAKPSDTSKAAIPKNKRFHVHIMDYTESLKPNEVAKLLRLGNVVPLKTTRLTHKTIYFTHPYESIDDAKKALEICLQQGFPDAEIEVVY
jgi:hypothetical protein